MASSSTSSIYKSFKYDVFLSFRGEDTRTSFVDHLYYALQQRGVNTYKDDEKIRKGKKICDELMESIENSKLYIIIFSKTYASSSWCLDELVKIMECHKTTEHTAYPLFYDVEPSEVRKQSGAVGEAFAKHENENSAGKWRESLNEAADLAGWELKNTADGHEAKFIQKVVEQISLELRSINFGSDEKLVGMETRINGVLSSLGTNFNDVRIIGIKGMGGAGKTTLARAVFDRISFQFEGKSFVEKVREVSKASPSGLKALQTQILSDVFKNNIMTVSSVHEGIGMMRKMMGGKKVLLVLDDVDHRDQLKALAGEMTWFKPGSMIIITTRDRQVLEYYQAKSIHDVQLLSNVDAMCLFCRYAFGRVIPNPGYEELSRQVVRYAAGLPLAIEVLGSFLCGKDELEWMDALLRLKTIPSQEILEILEISYRGLENDYKDIFLNVSCLLKGWSKAKAIKVLESCGYYAKTGLRILEQRSLITVDLYGRLDMHDHIEEMGKHIVRRLHPDRPSKHSRLWIGNEIEDILANNLGTKATTYMTFEKRYFSPQNVMKGLRKIKELRFLHVSLGNNYNESKSDSFRQNWKFSEFPNALRYLCWRFYPFWSLPKTFQADNLVALEMPYSKIIQLWTGGERKVLNKLRFLDLSYSKLRILELGSASSLELLDLTGCRDLIELHMPARSLNFRSLKVSHSKLKTLDIGVTPNLEYLHLLQCHDLEELHMSNECQKLTFLYISYSKLRNLDLGFTPNLQTLALEKCYNLVELHMANECLRKLVCLDLNGCLRLTTFMLHAKSKASGMKNVSVKADHLAELHLIAEPLDGCPLHPDHNLPKFRFKCFCKEDRPLSTKKLEKLISSGLCACKNFNKFLRSICGLQRIRKLKLGGSSILEAFNTKIKHLPDDIRLLKHLKSIKLGYCSLIEKLPEDLGRSECLKNIHFSDIAIKDLHDSIRMLQHRESLELYAFSSLGKLPDDIGRLKWLRKLSLRSVKIKDLPDSICMLKPLQALELNRCSLLEKLPEDLGRLECLEKLNLAFCKFLRDIPDSICKMKCLKHLNLDYCIQLKKLPYGLGSLGCLKQLSLRGTCISHLPRNIFLLEGLRIVASREFLESCGTNHKSRINF